MTAPAAARREMSGFYAIGAAPRYALLNAKVPASLLDIESRRVDREGLAEYAFEDRKSARFVELRLWRRNRKSDGRRAVRSA